MVEEARQADLVVVDGDTDDGHAGALGDGAHGAAHAAPGVQHRHARLGFDLVGDAQLVADDGRVEALALVARREVERLAPARACPVERGRIVTHSAQKAQSAAA